VPPEHILAHGTDDPLADATTQAGRSEVGFERPAGDRDLIEGELMTFADPLRELPPIDRLEGFRPEGYCLYQRVMIRVQCGRKPEPAWTYSGAGLSRHGDRARSWP
jgi:hypothetical protein